MCDKAGFDNKHLARLNGLYRNPSSLTGRKISLVEKLLSKYKCKCRLFDIGCGTGELIERVRDRFNEIVGIDVSSKVVDFCIRRFMNDEKVRIMKLDANKLDRIPGYFDAVTALDVLEHLNNIEDVTRSVYKILRSGGIFVTSTPNWYDKIKRRIYMTLCIKMRIHQ